VGESTDRYEIPDAVKIGRRLRDRGLVSTTDPLPLTFDAALEELRRCVRTDRDAEEPPLFRSDGKGPNDAAAGTDQGGSLVEYEDVSFSYDGEEFALTDLSLTLESGCVCVIGQNGAGKSTFMKHLNRLLTPTEGSVVVNGRDTRDYRIAELAGEAAVSFQDPNNQLFHSTIEEEVGYGPENIGYPDDRREQLVEEALDRMDLQDIRDKNPYDVGLARRKHVAVASVLAMDTPIVALDEPTGSQDITGIRLLGDVVDRLVSEGKLVIVITHDIAFARDHADRVVALREGELLLDGDPREVFGRGEELAKTDVDPPFVTRLGTRLDLPEPVLTIDELFSYVG
jgi:energy-coupling factor transport system ATP-binding protein